MWVDIERGRREREGNRRVRFRYVLSWETTFNKAHTHAYERHEGRKRAIWGEEEDKGGKRGGRRK